MNNASFSVINSGHAISKYWEGLHEGSSQTSLSTMEEKIITSKSYIVCADPERDNYLFFMIYGTVSFFQLPDNAKQEWLITNTTS